MGEGCDVIEKHETRRIKQEIGLILWTVWDPIGVNSHPRARDEYDSYVSPVYMMLTDGSEDSQIASYLLNVATDRMGLSGPKIEDMLTTVKVLREIKIPRDKA